METVAEERERAMTKKEKLLKLLDFYVLRSPIAKDIYIVEYKHDYMHPERTLHVGFATEFTQHSLEKKSSPAQLVFDNLFAVKPADFIEPIRLHIGTTGMLRLLGKPIDKLERAKVLGLEFNGISRAWKLSSAPGMDELKLIMARSLFDKRTRKTSEPVVFFWHGKNIEVVPPGSIDELLIQMDLAMAAEEQREDANRQ